MILTSARPTDGATVTITIRKVGVLAFGDCQYMHVFNILMRHCLQNLNLQQVSGDVNRNFTWLLLVLKKKAGSYPHKACSYARVMCVIVCVHVYVHSYPSLSNVLYFEICNSF
jgi:hypothetical protein